jgi:hypothetical protein
MNQQYAKLVRHIFLFAMLVRTMIRKYTYTREHKTLQEEPMFCTKCGNQLNEGAAFCPKCGTAASAPPLPETAPAVNFAQAPAQYPPAQAVPIPQAPSVTRCPGCGADIPAANINQSTGMALCAACGGVFRLAELTAAPAQPSYQAPPPYQNAPAPQYRQMPGQAPVGPAPQYAPATQPAQPYRMPDAKPKAATGVTVLKILSVAAPLYVVGFIVGINGEIDDVGIEGMSLYGSLLVQGIFAFIQSIKQKKRLILALSIIEVLFCVFVMVTSIFNGYLYAGFYATNLGSLILEYFLYPLVFCVITLAWFSEKKKLIAALGLAAVTLLSLGCFLW